MAKDDQNRPKASTLRPPKPQAPVRLVPPRPPEPKTLVLGPRAIPAPKTIVPPRPRRDDQSFAVPPRPPLREEPRRYEPPEPTLVVPLGDDVRSQIDSAKRSGDQRALKRAAVTGAALGIDDEAANAERRAQGEKRQRKFDAAIASAREALEEARSLRSEGSISRSIHRVGEALSKASRNDPQGRNKTEILVLLGTNQEELELLPTLFFTTATCTPVDYVSMCRAQQERDPDFNKEMVIPCSATYEKRGEQRSSEDFVFVKWIEMDGRKVSVFSRSGRVSITLEPTPQIAPGSPIDPPRPKIVLLQDGSYRLVLPDANYLMRRERSVVKDGQLIGEDRWVYHLLDPDDNYDPEVHLIGSVRKGLNPEPCLLPIIRECEVDLAKPMVAVILEIDGEHWCFVGVHMKDNHVLTDEAPWSEELLGTEKVPAAIDLFSFALPLRPKATSALSESNAELVTTPAATA